MADPKLDAYVCRPAVVINNPRTAVLIQFERMDPVTFRAIGAGHQIAMTVPDAMRLLGLLQTVQQEYNLPQMTSEPEQFEVPKRSD